MSPKSAIAATAALSLFSATARAQDIPPVPASCPHVGTEWMDQRVAGTGGTQCPSAHFKLTVGIAAGGQITVEFRGCPTMLMFQPGHNAQTQKAHFYVGLPQQLRWWRQSFAADCGGWFSSPRCIPSKDTETLDHFVVNWTEFACTYH